MLNVNFTGTYKSLEAFSIEGLPRLCVITGPNGAGKTQFLELIQSSLNARANPRASLSGETYTPQEVLRLTSEWTNLSNSSAIGFQVVQQQHDNFWNQFRAFGQNPNNPTHLKPLFQSLLQELGKPPAEVTLDEFTQNFDLSAPAAQTQVFNETVGQAFLDFRIRQLEAASRSETVSGKPPWQLLREIIAEAGLPFTFTDPSGISIRSTYTLTLTNTRFGKTVQFSELSSGEKVLMSLAFWLFHVRRTKVFPRLLLLDEPDAHLHPEMSKQFLNVIDGVLVKNHGVRVMIATHNPATVALADRASLYEMFPTGERIRKTQSKSAAIRRLTAGILDVSDAKSVVIVEDEDDQTFFQYLYDELSVDVEDSTKTIRNGERLVFVQASRPRQDRRPEETTGGRSEVEKWVPKLRQAGLELIVGLVDWDRKDESGDTIFLLPRYSMENYIVDPIVLFARLIAEQQAPPIDGVPVIAKNRSHTVVEIPQQQLQLIADLICNKMWERIKETYSDEHVADACSQQQITFLSGVTLMYPKWMMEHRGKDLLRACIDEFDGRYVNQRKLTDSFQQLMMIPKDLTDTLVGIQAPGLA